ncbi:DNA mismatch repair protein MutS [Hartmannibacter diazotrophicus]|uniref:DNA mismatch repair protein MutS n=1 Tax=Hartmannibacter diazotrophicus TaxID=1482074 RepID=A0A2C9D027_9HYPH|nr:Smr/MutS family protein [Hartmannibacter diazotrophicus]SON53549.1 DNA mismatch repair protein MutS [Hartmannibacter diazotrophicus]
MARDRRRRGLSEEEQRLWTAVKQTVKPMHPEARQPEPPPVPVEDAPESAAAGRDRLKSSTAGSSPKPPTPQKPAVKPALPPLQPVARKTRQKLVRDPQLIEARIDLHGLTQADAHHRLVGFLHTAQARGLKVVLVITGKGGTPYHGFTGLHLPERGVLRRVVPQWLALPDLRRIVHGYEEAHVSHGGAGALYVFLRRAKPGRP